MLIQPGKGIKIFPTQKFDKTCIGASFGRDKEKEIASAISIINSWDKTKKPFVIKKMVFSSLDPWGAPEGVALEGVSDRVYFKIKYFDEVNPERIKINFGDIFRVKTYKELLEYYKDDQSEIDRLNVEKDYAVCCGERVVALKDCGYSLDENQYRHRVIRVATESGEICHVMPDYLIPLDGREEINNPRKEIVSN